MKPPLIRISEFGCETLFVKDESSHPTHTFKDRLASAVDKYFIEKIHPSKAVWASISYGNTAYSLGFCARQRNEICRKDIVTAVAFVPLKLSDRSFGPDTDGKIVDGKTYLKKIEELCIAIPIDLDERYWTSPDLEKKVRELGIDGEFIDVTEGLGHLGRTSYTGVISESLEQIGGVPDYVIVPFGAGILYNETVDYLRKEGIQTRVIPVSVGDSMSIADKLYGPIWIEDVGGLKAKGTAKSKHKEFPCIIHGVEDSEILDALDRIKKHGIKAEASGAAGFALVPRLKQICPEFDKKKHSVLVINTGDGLLNF